MKCSEFVHFSIDVNDVVKQGPSSNAFLVPVYEGVDDITHFELSADGDELQKRV